VELLHVVRAGDDHDEVARLGPDPRHLATRDIVCVRARNPIVDERHRVVRTDVTRH